MSKRIVISSAIGALLCISIVNPGVGATTAVEACSLVRAPYPETVALTLATNETGLTIATATVFNCLGHPLAGETMEITTDGDASIPISSGVTGPDGSFRTVIQAQGPGSETITAESCMAPELAFGRTCAYGQAILTTT